MVTQELISYVRGEVNKGKTREEIRSSLLSGGGWSEADISEVFRIVIPLANVIESKPITSIPAPIINPTVPPPIITPKKSFKLSHRTKELLIIALVAAILGGSGYYYRSALGDTLSRVQDRIANLSFKKEEAPKIENKPNVPVVQNNQVEDKRLMPPKDCGVTVAPDIKNMNSIGNVVLECLGESAKSCTPAKAILTSPLMPTMIEITKGDTSDDMECKFNLSYEETSTLTSVTGEKLAGKNISCPVEIVRSIAQGDKNTLVFGEPSKSNLSKYGAEIYFYGTTGVFLEQEFSKKEIEEKGCTGGYIDLVIDSYNRSKQ